MLPDGKGVYALSLCLTDVSTFRVMGRQVTLPPGRYVYVGSARGPGGLRARLGRHLRGDGHPHWHIDALRALATVEGYACWTGDGVTECALAQALAALPDAYVPMPGFGASDCRLGCSAHLVAVSLRLPLARLWSAASGQALPAAFG